jgi:hypothetical protein
MRTLVVLCCFFATAASGFAYPKYSSIGVTYNTAFGTYTPYLRDFMYDVSPTVDEINTCRGLSEQGYGTPAAKLVSIFQNTFVPFGLGAQTCVPIIVGVDANGGLVYGYATSEEQCTRDWRGTFAGHSVLTASECSHENRQCSCASLEAAGQTTCPEMTEGGACIASPGLADYEGVQQLISCSCQGRCVRAFPVQFANDLHQSPYHNPFSYAPPSGFGGPYRRPNNWEICACAEPFYGERCQFRKAFGDIASLVGSTGGTYQTTVNIAKFPFLPWYHTEYERNSWLALRDQLKNLDSTTPPDCEYDDIYQDLVVHHLPPRYLTGHTLWSYVNTLAVRNPGSSYSTWSWFNMEHGCPYGFIAEETWDQLEYSNSKGYTADRSGVTCQCNAYTEHISDPNNYLAQRNGCSRNGACQQYINGVAGISFSGVNQCVDNAYSQQHFFPNPGYSSLGFDRLRRWNLCECMPGFDGLYCEIDVRRDQLCGGHGEGVVTTYSPQLTDQERILFYDECKCDSGYTMAEKDQQKWPTPGTPPPGMFDNRVFYNGPVSFPRASDGVPRTSDPITYTLGRVKNLCVKDLDPVCNKRGTWNSAMVMNNPTGRTVGCECFAYFQGQLLTFDRGSNFTAYNNVRELLANLAGGPDCVSTCSASVCSGHGVCRLTSRAAWRAYYERTFGAGAVKYPWGGSVKYGVEGKWMDQDRTFMPSPFASQTNRVVPTFAIEPDPTKQCWCDEGWAGDNCATPVGVNANCDSLASPVKLSQIDQSHTMEQYILLNGCSTLCDDSARTNAEWVPDYFRCMKSCPAWTEATPLDTVAGHPNGLVCGGPLRGMCTGYDTISLTPRRVCQCLNGYTNSDKGCSDAVCPRVYGLTCAGNGQCRVDAQGAGVWRCTCDKGWMGHACDVKIYKDSNVCQANTQQVVNDL